MDGEGAQTLRARLFVALDLPEEVRVALARWGAKAGEAFGGTLRAVPPENLHLTMAFLGARSEREAPAIGAIVTATTTAGATPQLSLGAPLWLPPRRPGVLTVEVDDHTGALTILHASLIAALQADAAFTPEARPFRPHITVGRVPRGHRIRPRDADLPPPPSATFHTTVLTLYRSRAGRYEPLVRHALL